jgi:hypothetical protein
MLFLYSFYSNKHPSIPACSQARSVETGGHHLAKVKFPTTAADQSKLNIPQLFLRSFRLGLGATRANLVPALLVQVLMASLVVSYFYLPAARPTFGVLTYWNVHGGLLFSFLAMGLSTNAPENAALPAILPLDGPPCFGVQLVFLDSDGRLDLLLSNLTSIASWNSSHCDLEHVDCSVSQAGRDGFDLSKFLAQTSHSDVQESPVN